MRTIVLLALALLFVPAFVSADGSASRQPFGECSTSEAECHSAYGKTVCGYHCVAGYGDVKCASTPNGACLAAYGKVECWDPPHWARRPALCLAEYGDIACGYGCVAAYGKVACSSNPHGTCQAAYGDIVCSD